MAKNHIIPIFITHKGCRHRCSFCNQEEIAGNGIELHGSDLTEMIMASSENTEHCCEIAFYGGSFTAIDDALQEELLEAVQPFIKAGTVSGIRLSTRPDCIDVEVIERLKRNGVHTVELGCQSMDDAVLIYNRRGHTAEQIRNALVLLKESGFNVICQMMTGLPGSSTECDFESGRQIAKLSPDGVRIYPSIVVPGTEMAMWYKKGEYRPETIEEAVMLCADLKELFDECSIPVLRFGLQPTDELLHGGVVAGPFHSAFGELVKSELILRHTVELIKAAEGDTLTLLVPEKQISAFYGQHRENYRKLRELFPKKNLIIRISMENEDIILQS